MSHLPLFPPGRFRFLVPILCVMVLNGCAVTRGFQEWSRVPPTTLEKEIERNLFSLEAGDDVIGRMAVVRLEKGDTLPDVARHFSLGINAVSAANPGVDVWVPRPGERVVLPLSFILPDAPRNGIVVNLASMRLFQFKGDETALLVSTYPVGVGTRERPTPTGRMHVKRKATRPTWNVPASIAEDHRKKGDPLPARVAPGPENPLGENALYLSKTGYLIHGTNKPSSIGLQATNGCLRLYPENVSTLYDDTPVNTPVVIVNQPYLVGQRGGVVFMEAHVPPEGSGGAEAEKMYAKLREFEKRSGRSLDWNKVKEVQGEARGYPVPILQMSPGEQTVGNLIEVEHPEKLLGKPEVPELRSDAWYVLAADVHDEIDALRTAAIINHQGPQIPARVLTNNSGYRVIAGPFTDSSKARDTVRRLKIDLGIEGLVIEPVKEI